MNPSTSHPVRYHTWKDIGGPIGLLFDGIFCAFVIVSALAMIVFAYLILVIDYAAAPVLYAVSKLQRHNPA